MHNKFPAPADLPKIKDFPDALTLRDGTAVKTKAQWEKRRKELKELFQYYEYGHLPPAPKNMKVRVPVDTTAMKGTVTVKRVQLDFGPKRALRIEAIFYIPKRRKGPFPVILGGDLCWGDGITDLHIAQEYIKRGYVIGKFSRTDLDLDNSEPYDGVHPLYPKYDWGTLAVWAWGYMRVVDYLMTAKFCDPEKIAITGHSRGGKTVLLAAALDERIALVCPNGSGTSGVGPHRYRYTGESLDEIVNMFPYWFNKRFAEFKGKNLNRLPVDQHELIALVAPRAFLATMATEDLHANPHGMQQAIMAAKKVYTFLGAEEKCGLWFREGIHHHSKKDWDALVDFCDRVFFNKKVKRRFDHLPYNMDEKPFE